MNYLWNQFFELIMNQFWDLWKSKCVGPCTPDTPDTHPSPDIAVLMASNEAPSDAQDAELRRLRLDGRNRLDKLDALIKETQETLAELQARRSAVSSQIAQHDIVLHPIRRVPPDVLCEIFALATSIGVSPYYITAICRSWRLIGTSFHLLWRKLTVPLLPPQRVYRSPEGIHYWDFEGARRLVPSLEAYIRNSDTSCIVLDIYINSFFPCTHPLYLLLIQIVNRVEQLHLHVCDPRVLEATAVRNLVQGSTGLQSLSLGFDPSYSMMAAGAISLPKTLRSLVIVPYVWLASPSIDLAWDGIKHLVLRSQYLGEAQTSSLSVKDILLKTKHLLSLTLSNSWDGTGLAEYHQPFPDLARGSRSVKVFIQTPFKLTRLEELILEHENANVLHVLDNVILPSMIKLLLVAPSANIVSIFKKMFRRSRCTLTHLTIRDASCMNTVVSLLRLCGSLRELSLLHCAVLEFRFIHDVLDFLLEGNGAQCPSLRVLVVDVSYATTSEHESVFVDRLLDFMELRCRSSSVDNSESGPSHLESVTLHAPREDILPFTPSHKERIRALRHSGFKFYMYRYAPSDPRMY